jgi:tetratricopeptide (TPR) repeat protein
MKSIKLVISNIVIMILLVLFIGPITYVNGEKKAEDYYLEGKDYYINGHYDQAIDSFAKAIKVNNNLADAYISRGHAYAIKPNPDLNQAISDFDRAIQINPLEDEAFTGRGIAYARQQKLDKAIADFNQAIKLNPQNALAYSFRGMAYGNKKDFSKAWQDVDKARSLGLEPPPEFIELLKKNSGRAK